VTRLRHMTLATAQSGNRASSFAHMICCHDSFRLCCARSWENRMRNIPPALMPLLARAEGKFPPHVEGRAPLILR